MLRVGQVKGEALKGWFLPSSNSQIIKDADTTFYIEIYYRNLFNSLYCKTAERLPSRDSSQPNLEDGIRLQQEVKVVV